MESSQREPDQEQTGNGMVTVEWLRTAGRPDRVDVSQLDRYGYIIQAYVTAIGHSEGEDPGITYVEGLVSWGNTFSPQADTVRTPMAYYRFSGDECWNLTNAEYRLWLHLRSGNKMSDEAPWTALDTARRVHVLLQIAAMASTKAIRYADTISCGLHDKLPKFFESLILFDRSDDASDKVA